jgi:hypothetical protein
MTTRTEDPTAEVGEDEVDQFIEQLQGDIVPSAPEIPVEVTVNVTRACSSNGGRAIDCVFPTNGDILDRGLSFNVAKQLAVDLDIAAHFVRDLRHDRGWDS